MKKPITRRRIDEIEAEAEGRYDDPFDRAGDDYYEPYFGDQIKAWAGEMMFPEEWAAELGVSETTMFSWIEKFPEFARAYSAAATRLRAAFTRHMRESMSKPGQFQAPALTALIAKKRFADLYGDIEDAPPAGAIPSSRVIAPAASVVDTIEGAAVPIQTADTKALEDELKALRARHGMS